jgi:hypothetical protein
LKRTGRSFLGGETQISKEEMLLLLNPEKISLLNSLPSEIILSSTWRHPEAICGHDAEELLRLGNFFSRRS